jgi:uncharacterized oligopeptide transporter (OPT) family protein
VAALQPDFPEVDDRDDDDRPGDWPWPAVVASICALIVVVPYWSVDYADVEDGGLSSFALPVAGVLGAAAFLLSALRLGHKLEIAIAMCLPAPIAVVGRILIDTADDPTTHSLWPFEIAVAIGISVPPVLLGIFLGWAVRRLVERRHHVPPTVDS